MRALRTRLGLLYRGGGGEESQLKVLKQTNISTNHTRLYCGGKKLPEPKRRQNLAKS